MRFWHGLRYKPHSFLGPDYVNCLGVVKNLLMLSPH